MQATEQGRGRRRRGLWPVMGVTVAAITAVGLVYPAASRAVGGQPKGSATGSQASVKACSARSEATSSDLVFVPRTGRIVDRTLPLKVKETKEIRFRALRWGKARLAPGKDFSVSGAQLTVKAAALARMVGSRRTDGVKAKLYADFSAGAPRRIDVITYDEPVLSDTTGTTTSFRIPVQLRGDVFSTMEAKYSDGGNAGPAGRTGHKESAPCFRVDSVGKAVALTSDFLTGVNDGKQVTLTFHFRSGSSVRYRITRSGSSVTGRPGGPTSAATTPTRTTNTTSTTNSVPTTSAAPSTTSAAPSTTSAVPSTTKPSTTKPTTPTPSTSRSSAAASAPLAGRIKPGETRTGAATFYQGAQNTGACSFDPSTDHMTAAMNVTDYENSKACGAYVEVHGSNGATITVRVTNLCPAPCRVGQLDLDPEAYKLLAPLQTGETPITWSLLSPNISGGISVRYKTGSSQWWCGIQAINHRNPVARLEVMASGAWKELPRAEYNYFLSANGSGCGGAIRVTDIYGQSLVVDPLPIKPDAVQQTSLQFAKH